MRIIALLTAVAFISLQLLAGGASSVSAGKTGCLPALVSGNNEFAFDMYKKISLADKEKNVFFSPLSISTALGMTYAGARGNTKMQMAEVLHFGLSQDDPHTAFSLLSDQMKGSDAKGYQLNIANALWGQTGYPFKADFLEVVRKNYGGGFNTIDFIADSEGSRQTINRWVEKNTADKIQNLLQPGDINALTRLVLTNAIYFKGDWAAKFNKKLTKPATFYIRPGETADVPMMRQTSRFGYAATDELQVLEMPYVGGELTMVVLLPKNGSEEFCAKVGPAELNKLLGSLREQEVAVSIPKFKFGARYSLGDMLSEMGMADAFDLPPADFSGMAGERNLCITGVIHQAVIEVNEEGSEAAAATAVIVGTKSVMAQTPEFKADRPFIFLIRHKSTGSILFMGGVANPSLK